MAVIQDLPAESIHRTLELVEVYDRRDLFYTSLVCRDWTAASQALLLRKVDGLSATKMQAITRHLAHVMSARVDHLDLSLYEPSAFQPASDLLKAAEGLRSIALYGETHMYVAAALLSPTIMANLEVLRIWVLLEGSLCLPSHIPLRSLDLRCSDLPPPAILDPILKSAGNLQSFGLYVNTSAPLPQSILDVAGRLTRLRLTDGNDELKSSCPSCLPLLAACTGLRSLDLTDWSVDAVAEMLQACRSELVMLGTAGTEVYDSAIASHRPLQAALKFSCLAKLKRWRLSWWPSPPANSGARDWRQACAERGIEVRGEERYFTD